MPPLTNSSQKAEQKIKDSFGYIKGCSKICCNCFNVFVDPKTGKMECELGHFEVEPQDSCNQWIKTSE